jgi:dipeptidyl aminopeptidase/acylaminoacyl peptidase
VPAAVQADRLPAIILLHGWPAEHDIWKVDREKQFLASRGYGVLSVNFRGSTGYGRAFQAAGYREFGRSMQDDVSDAAAWLVNQRLADPKAIAAMGSSYAGYSAALAMTQDPPLFSAAILEHAVTDLKYQMEKQSFSLGALSYPGRTVLW